MKWRKESHARDERARPRGLPRQALGDSGDRRAEARAVLQRGGTADGRREPPERLSDAEAGRADQGTDRARQAWFLQPILVVPGSEAPPDPGDVRGGGDQAGDEPGGSEEPARD